MWTTLASLVLLVSLGVLLSRRSTREIPILVNGLIPSLPDATSKEDSGTTVYIVYTDDDQEEIFRGYADVDGKVEAKLAVESIGREVLIRARHSAYKPAELVMTIPEQGIVHTIELSSDGLSSGRVRGADVGELGKYYKDALAYAEARREQFILNLIVNSQRPFARIPTSFWIGSYATFLVAFAIDYWVNIDGFSICMWDSFWHALYFSAVTITTLGYGEITPETDLLRVAVSAEAILGILLMGFALNSLFNGMRPGR